MVSILFEEEHIEFGKEELVSEKGVDSRFNDLGPSPLAALDWEIDIVERSRVGLSCILKMNSWFCRRVLQIDEEANRSLGQQHFASLLYTIIGCSVTAMVVIKSGHENHHKMSPLEIFPRLGSSRQFHAIAILSSRSNRRGGRSLEPRLT